MSPGNLLEIIPADLLDTLGSAGWRKATVEVAAVTRFTVNYGHF